MSEDESFDSIDAATIEAGVRISRIPEKDRPLAVSMLAMSIFSHSLTSAAIEGALEERRAQLRGFLSKLDQFVADYTVEDAGARSACRVRRWRVWFRRMTEDTRIRGLVKNGHSARDVRT